MKVNDTSRLLVEALQDRNLGVNTTEHVRELSSEDQDVRGSWISKNLGHETLLTKEELYLYHALQKIGQVDALLEQEEENHVRALTDREIQQAIEQLQSSTAAIEKQSEILRIQQDAVASLVALNGRQAKSRSHANGLQHRTWIAENEQLNGEIEELVGGLSDYVVDLESQAGTSDTTLAQHASEILHSDDKILASLKKLSERLQQGSSGSDDHAERIKQLCASLIKYTVEGIRVRLDRVYIEGLEGNSGSLEKSREGQSAEMTALKEELESLYSEIIPVAQMSAEQRYLQLALRSIAAQGGQGAERSKKIAEYVSRCMAFLIQRLESFSTKVEDYQEHISTLRSVVQLLRTDIATITSPPTIQPQQPPSPTTKRRKSRIVSLGRPRMPHRRSSSLSFDESTPPEHQILQVLGLPLPDSPVTEASITNTLHSTLEDRLQKLRAHETSLQISSEAAISEHLQDAFITLQLLQDSLLSESQTGRIELVDEDVQAAISGLELELGDLRADLQNVDLERLRERDVNREAFIDRWTH